MSRNSLLPFSAPPVGFVSSPLIMCFVCSPICAFSLSLPLFVPPPLCWYHFFIFAFLLLPPYPWAHHRWGWGAQCSAHLPSCDFLKCLKFCMAATLTDRSQTRQSSVLWSRKDQRLLNTTAAQSSRSHYPGFIGEQGPLAQSQYLTTKYNIYCPTQCRFSIIISSRQKEIFKDQIFSGIAVLCMRTKRYNGSKCSGSICRAKAGLWLQTSFSVKLRTKLSNNRRV